MKPEFLRILSLLATALVLAACSVEPEPIAYGSDTCAFCRMTIVDKTHAAEYVTRKGKPFTYDAIECLVQDLTDRRTEQIGLLLVADYAEPGTLINANSAIYLISEGIKSPMGAYLSAFSTRQAAEAARTENGGALYSWEDLPKELKVE